MDGLYLCFSERGRNKLSIKSMKNKLFEEEYDSDALMEDMDVLKNYDPNSNISQFIQTKDEYQGIRDYIYNIKCYFYSQIYFQYFSFYFFFLYKIYKI